MSYYSRMSYCRSRMSYCRNRWSFLRLKRSYRHHCLIIALEAGQYQTLRHHHRLHRRLTTRLKIKQQDR
jgi:hypothetical protein